MRHLKTFENFQSINEEEIIGKVGAFFGAANEEGIKKAESKLTNPPKDFKPKDLGPKIKEFNTYKDAFKRNPKSEDAEIFKQMVKHINLNNEAVYKVEIKDGKKIFSPGVRYGKEGGAGAHGGGGS
jgi:hypothetical protein